MFNLEPFIHSILKEEKINSLYRTGMWWLLPGQLSFFDQYLHNWVELNLTLIPEFPIHIFNFFFMIQNLENILWNRKHQKVLMNRGRTNFSHRRSEPFLTLHISFEFQIRTNFFISFGKIQICEHWVEFLYVWFFFKCTNNWH